MPTKYLQFVKSKWFIAVACLALGAVIILGIRFATYKVAVVHYHANFALYINGQREEFKGQQYYTEVEVCTLDKTIVPSERAHMHDNVNDVVHVEDHAVTWGQFFRNLGWVMGPSFMASPDGTIYSENGNNKLHLILNGQDYTGVDSLDNNVIKDTDKLLVSYGDQSGAQTNQQYAGIPSTAAKFDKTKDPSSCSGSHTTNLRERLNSLL